MFKYLFILSVLQVGIVLANAAAHIPTDIVRHLAMMRESGQACLSDYCEEFGKYILTMALFELSDDLTVQETTELALIKAKHEIASFIGQRVSGQESAGSQNVSDGVKTEILEYFHSSYSTHTEQFLSGVVVYDVQKTANAVYVTCLLSEKNIDLSCKMKDMMEKHPPDTVSATGFACIVENRLDQAKQESKQAALRSAVEQVLGTALLGNTQVQDNQKIRSKVFSQAAGFIDEYRIVREDILDQCYMTLVYAKVSKNKLLESYTAFLQSFGDPYFLIRTENLELFQTFAQFFTGLGLKITAEDYNADYIIDAIGNYDQLRHPASGIPGIQLSLWIRISDAKTQQELLSQKNDPRKAAVFYSTGERQKDIATQKAFEQIKVPLHKALNQMIGKMAMQGRPITVSIENYSSAYSKAMEEILKALEAVPGCENVNRKVDLINQNMTFSANYRGKMDDLEMFLVHRLKKELPDKYIPKTEIIETNLLRMSY